MTQFEWIAAAIIAAISTARITRLVVWDTFPPSAHLRAKWADWTDGGAWEDLLKCGYCFGVYAAAFTLGTGWLSVALVGDLHWSWWLFHGWMALSYVAAIIMTFDGELMED